MIRPASPALLLLLTAALVAPATSAPGAPPSAVDPTPEVLAAGEACPFAIEVVAAGKEGFIELPHNPQYSAIAPAPGLRLTVTNLEDPEQTVTVNASGAFRYVDLPGGATEIRASGRNFFYGVLGVGATALSTKGPVTAVVSPDGELVALDVSRARVRDLCAELA